MPYLNEPWQIIIDRFDGFVPAFWTNSNPTVGLPGQASDMTNVDLTDPNVLTQGPGLTQLTNGTQAGAVTTLIAGMLRIARVDTDGTYCYGVGGAKLYEFTSSAVTNAGSFPRTIVNGGLTGITGQDVVEYGGNIFYSYYSDTVGDIGRYTGAATFDDDFMSTVPAGANALNNPFAGYSRYQMIVGGDDILYIGHSRYIATYDKDVGANGTFTQTALDLPEKELVTSIAWNHNRLYIASNRPNTAPTRNAESSIYLWDTISSSWEYQIKVMGRIGALYAKNGFVFVWYQDVSSTGGYKLGVVAGQEIQDLAFFTGSLPEFYQVMEHKNHLMWVSSGEVWAWGASDTSLPPRLFQYADAGLATGGGITNIFGTPTVASFSGSNYQLNKFSDYTVSCDWKSMLFDVSRPDATGVIEKIVILTEPLSVGARADLSIYYDFASAVDTAPDVLAYDSTNTTKTRWTVQRNGQAVENFRLDLSWAQGSTSNPVKIRKIMVLGRYVPNL